MWAPRHSFVTFDFLGKLYVISGVESHESDETASTADFRHDVWSSQVYIYIYTHARARTHTHTHTVSLAQLRVQTPGCLPMMTRGPVQDGVSWTRVTAVTPWAATATRHGRRAVAGGIHQLTMYVLAESSDYRFYYNVWGSRDGEQWQEPTTACVVSGQPLGAAVVVGSGMVLLATSDLALGTQDVKLWYSTELQLMNASFTSAKQPVGQGPRRGAAYVVFRGQILQIGGSCHDCGKSQVQNDAFSDVWQNAGVVTMLDSVLSPASTVRPAAAMYVGILAAAAPTLAWCLL